VLTEAGLAGERPDTEEGRPAARVQRRPARSKRRRRTGGLPATGRGGERPAQRRDLHDVLGWLRRASATADRGGGGSVLSGGGGTQGGGSAAAC
jgi:hypothetical protein